MRYSILMSLPNGDKVNCSIFTTTDGSGHRSGAESYTGLKVEAEAKRLSFWAAYWRIPAVTIAYSRYYIFSLVKYNFSLRGNVRPTVAENMLRRSHMLKRLTVSSGVLRMDCSVLARLPPKPKPRDDAKKKRI